MSEPAVELPAGSGHLAGAAEDARRGVVTHITVDGERVAAIVPESLVRVLDQMVALLSGDVALAALPRVLAEAFPWARSLPGHELRLFAGELREAAATTATAAADVDRVITEWRATAEAYADPPVLGALRAPFGDFGPVPEPTGR
ncbi:MAG: hypothetical protein ACYCO9_17220 [Streptosporangiaceae bacterium]